MSITDQIIQGTAPSHLDFNQSAELATEFRAQYQELQQAYLEINDLQQRLSDAEASERAAVQYVSETIGRSMLTRAGVLSAGFGIGAVVDIRKIAPEAVSTSTQGCRTGSL